MYFSFAILLLPNFYTLTVGKVKNCMLLLFNHLGNFDLGQVFYSNDKANGAQEGSVVSSQRQLVFYKHHFGHLMLCIVSL